MKVLTDEFGKVTGISVNYYVEVYDLYGDIDPDTGKDLYTYEFVRIDNGTERYLNAGTQYKISAWHFPQRWLHEYPVGAFYGDGQQVTVLFRFGDYKMPYRIIKYTEWDEVSFEIDRMYYRKAIN